MHIEVDADKCTGHGRCYALAPDVFDADDYGHCVVLVTLVEPGTELHGQAVQAVDNCPERAITLLA
jgi:ferredoxin